MLVGMPADITPTDTSAGWTERGQKLLVTGVVYGRDGRTPAPYPQSDIPAHIELVFDDDPLLTAKRRKQLKSSGNIVLGLNIPNYPQTSTTDQQSGLSIGEDRPSFQLILVALERTKSARVASTEH